MVTLTIAFLVLSAVVLFIASSLDIYFNVQDQRKMVASQQQLVAREAANAVKGFVQEKIGLLGAANSIGDLAIAHQERQKIVLEKLLGLEPSFRQLVLFNEKKQSLQRASRVSDIVLNQLTKQVGSELFSEVRQGKPYISSIYIDNVTSEPLVIMAVAVTNVFGDFKGTLMAEVNLKFMWNLVSNMKIGRKGQAYVVDRQGNLIAFGDISRVLRGENLIKLKEVHEFVNSGDLAHKKEADISKGIRSTYVVATHAPLSRPDWAVVVELPVLEAYETVVKALGLSVFVMFISFILAIVAGVYLSKRITNPIIKLRDATRIIGKGKLRTKIEVQTKDEIGELATSFNQMMADLKKITVSRNSLVKEVKLRERTEKALQKSEKLYRSLIETTKVGVSAINENGIIIYANDRHCEIWGYPLDEIMGHRVSEFLDEENLKILQEQLDKRKEGGREPYEIAWKRKDGKNVPTILSPTPIFDTDGQYKGSYGFITDITERKRMEKRLQRYAAELERSNEEVKNFAYIVSHDLRVPLVNLKGYSDELRSALGVIGANFDAVLPQLPDEKRSEVALALHEDVPEALEFITNSVSRMDSFINAVLQLSRLGRRDLKPEPIDMNALVQTNLETLAHQIHERGIKVTVGSLPQVVADRTSIEQIMGNIMGNAVKYLDPERPGQIKITAETNNSEQLFRIRDNGRGIAEDDMDKVFAPFRRAGKQDTPGEGMGLAYVQTLVRRHNGRIWCESELGKGTTMTFTISPHRAGGEDYVSN
jgi:PAS domain S-box-containing protein